jgi:hypothetical protein
MRSKVFEPTGGGWPTTMAEDGEVIQSVSRLDALEMRYFIVVSKLIFKKGELDSSIPIRLNAL